MIQMERACLLFLTQILTSSRLYVMDMGKEGRARDSRPPPSHPPGKPDESW
jgi:hypothetical protein